MNDQELQFHTPVGRTNYRKEIPFYIKDIDRQSHIYVLGKSGTGKSTLLKNMAISDIQKSKGVAVIDPHGQLAEDLLNYIPEHRIPDIIYFNPSDVTCSIGFNPLRNVHPDHHYLVAAGMIATFKKIWDGKSWGPRMEYIFNFALLTLLEYRRATLLDVQPLLTNRTFRNQILLRIKNPHLLEFWGNEFETYSPAMKAEAVSPILNKIGLFRSSIPLRNVVGQAVSSFSFQDILDTGKVFIANLSKGTLGEDVSALFGSMIITAIQQAALCRAILKEEDRRPFYLYVDEAHSFLTASFADILSEARKYRLSLYLTHQYINQLDETVRDAVFGNVGTLIAFRVGSTDAEVLEKEFYPVFTKTDFVNLSRYSIYLKMMIDGATSEPFSAVTFPLSKCMTSFMNEAKTTSRKAFCRTREEIEKEIFQNTKINNSSNSLF